jgi:hypothetical protein
MTSLPFVISTEAKRSGEISVWMLFLGSVFSKALPRDPECLLQSNISQHLK